MLACVLGVLLIQGVLEIYLGTKKIADLQMATARLQENARFATHFLTQHIRMAGDFSCESSPPMVDPVDALQGYHQSNLPPSLRNKARPGTDSVMIKRCRVREGREILEKYLLFIGETTRKDAAGNKVYALYESPLVGDKVELVPDIVDMRIQYGVASGDGQGVQTYVPAAGVVDWKRVKSLEIVLLLKSLKFEKPWHLYVTLRERHE